MSNKLAIKFKDVELAAKLTAAKLVLPAEIRKATDGQLAQAGLSKDEIAKVRGKMPRANAVFVKSEVVKAPGKLPRAKK